jgi:sterol desaturase/sphingolipid hydroxylase (fatty acid hydroxylase superfamily)
MNMFLLNNEVVLRLGFFVSIFLGMALWEKITPRRPLTQKRSTRWSNNLGLTAFNAVLVFLVFPVAAVGTALYAEEKGWGLFSWLHLPGWLEGIAAIFLLDLTIYLQHVLFHKIPLFWRFHKMHHTDLDIDVTTGARFHPVEILLSMVIKMGIVLTIGAPAWSVIVFEILLNGTSMFNHSDAYMPPRADDLLRLLVVTPDMHRVHHSVIIRETDSNFGFNFPWWDRFFRTYRAQPAAGHTEMKIGLANYQDPKWLTFHWMLLVPFMHKER